MANPTPQEIDAAIPVAGTPSRALTNAALKAMATAIEISAGSGGIADDDPRLSDSRAPNGGAGGVLSGTYPNPGFAVDMATQAELDAGLDSKISTSERGANNGIAPLDASGKIPAQYISGAFLTFRGAWNPTTGTPALLDGTGTVGSYYKASASGTYNFGGGTYKFNVGDWVIYAGGTWQRIGIHNDGVPIGTPLAWLADTLPHGYIWIDDYSPGAHPALDSLFPSGIPPAEGMSIIKAYN